MGDIKRLRKKYVPPAHPWNRQAIDAERKLLQEFGLQRKKEIHKHHSFLKKYKDIAKRLIANATVQGLKEKEQMIKKLSLLGLISPSAALDDILSLQLPHILERRLESIIFRKGLAKTMKQARQFIVQGHIQIGEKGITSPSYLVPVLEEAKLQFKPSSALAFADHPERIRVPLPFSKSSVKIVSPEVKP